MRRRERPVGELGLGQIWRIGRESPEGFLQTHRGQAESAAGGAGAEKGWGPAPRGAMR